MPPDPDRPQSPAPGAPDQRRDRDRHQFRNGVFLILGGIILLGGLALWMHRLQSGTPPAAGDDPDAGTSAAPLIPDGPETPGAPAPVAFAGERCTPWHISASQAPPPEENRYLILNTRIGDTYGYVASGFHDRCGPGHPILTVEQLEPQALETAIAEQQPSALVAVGSAAAEMARSAAPELPLLYARIPDPGARGLDRGEAFGILPWIPAEPLARHLLRVLPGSIERLAVLHPAGRLQTMAEQAAATISAAGRQAAILALPAEADWTPLLEKAAATADGWLLLIDRERIDAAAFNQVQIAAERAELPLCVSDEDHVRRYAYAGAGIDNHRIGQQLCLLAGALEREALPPGRHVFCPEYSFAVLHNAALEKLGYILDPEQLRQVKLYKWH